MNRFLTLIAIAAISVSAAPALATATSPGDLYFNAADVPAGTVYIPASIDLTTRDGRHAATDMLVDAITGRHVGKVGKVAVSCDARVVYIGDVTPDARSLFRANLDDRLRNAPTACVQQR